MQVRAQIRILLAFVAAIAEGFGLCVNSAPMPVNSADYVVEGWTAESGLPQNSITSMAQTADGYLWLATFNGLARFDGVRFIVLNPVNTPALRSARITSVHVDRNGALWIFTEEGFVSRMAHGFFEEVNGKFGLPSGNLSEKGMDPDGNVWLKQVDTPPVCWLDGDHFIPGRDVGITARNFRDVVGTARSLWFRDEAHWARGDKDRFAETLSAAFGKLDKFVPFPARDGDTWVVTQIGVVKLRAGGPLRPFPNGMRIEEPTDAAEDADGNLIIGTWSQGLLIFTRDGRLESLPLKDGAGTMSIRTVMVDREGNRWIGTDVAGLHRLKRKTFRTYLQSDGLASEVVRSIAEDKDGRIWCAMNRGIDLLDRDGLVRHVVDDGEVWWAIGSSKDGQIWAGGFSGAISAFHGTNQFPVANTANVRAVAPSWRGGVWVGTRSTLVNSDGDFKTQEELPASALVYGVRAIYEDEKNLWIGLYGDGLWRRTEGKWVKFGAAQGLTDEHVTSLFSDSEGALWIGTVFGGLHRFKNGTMQNFQTTEPALPSHVLCILEDDLGFLWVGAVNGIFRVARSEMAEFAEEGKPLQGVQFFDRSDGLGTTEISEGRQPVALKARDGRVWFATINGLSVADPKSVPSNPNAPRVIIEELLVNGQPAGLENGLLTIPALSKRVEIRYTGISFDAASRVRFKRRLRGLDDSWIDVGNQRSATYYDLAPGGYRFEVMAANRDGVWTTSAAGVEMKELAAFWQTRWFQVGIAATLLGIAGGAVRLRLRAAERAQAQREAFSQELIESQEQERQRIAGELHDGLGQDLLVIKNQAAMRMARAPEVESAAYKSISETAAQALRQVREISYNLRPYQLDELGLTAALRGIFSRLSLGMVQFDANIDEIDGIFSARDESHIFRITQELTNNILKHSGATMAKIEIRKAREHLQISAADNGCGMPDAVNGNGMGLRGMRERARILHGTIQIAPHDGKGAVFEILIPLPERFAGKTDAEKPDLNPRAKLT